MLPHEGQRRRRDSLRLMEMMHPDLTVITAVEGLRPIGEVGHQPESRYSANERQKSFEDAVRPAVSLNKSFCIAPLTKSMTIRRDRQRRPCLCANKSINRTHGAWKGAYVECRN